MQDNNKTARHQAIRKIITEHKIGGQEELLSHLARKGFHLTQATLSRDLRALKIAKAADIHGTYHYVLPQIANNPVHPILTNREKIQQGGISIEFSGQFAVLKTRPGYANGIAADIDGKQIPEIMGTIAGDDTVLLILRENISKNHIMDILSGFIPNLFKQ